MAKGKKSKKADKKSAKKSKKADKKSAKKSKKSAKKSKKADKKSKKKRRRRGLTSPGGAQGLSVELRRIELLTSQRVRSPGRLGKTPSTTFGASATVWCNE